MNDWPRKRTKSAEKEYSHRQLFVFFAPARG